MNPILNGYGDRGIWNVACRSGLRLVHGQANAPVSLVTRWLDHTSSRNVWQVTFTLEFCKMNCRSS